MAITKSKRTSGWLALGALVLSGVVSTAALAQAPAVDPAATQILKRMTDYLSGLQQFSVHTQNDIEDLLDSGQRVDFDVSANVIISRPDKLRAERRGDLVNQTFYYNGKALTLYDPSNRAYATVQAPPNIEETLDFARASLGLMVPASDLIYRNAYELLMQDVTSAIVVDKAVINGVKCDHLAFSRPGVDFQVWVADGAQPLPRKYIVTDTGTPALLSVTTVMSEWNVNPEVADERFTFVPPQGAKEIAFMRLDGSTTSSR
jgi:hypothetical protein